VPLTIHHVPPPNLPKPSVASKPPLAYRRDRRTDTTRFDHPHSTTDIGRNMVTPIHTCHVLNRSAGGHHSEGLILQFLPLVPAEIGGLVLPTSPATKEMNMSLSLQSIHLSGSSFNAYVNSPALFSRSGAAPYAYALSCATPGMQACSSIHAILRPMAQHSWYETFVSFYSWCTTVDLIHEASVFEHPATLQR
jgi:hypothetical protein